MIAWSATEVITLVFLVGRFSGCLLPLSGLRAYLPLWCLPILILSLAVWAFPDHPVTLPPGTAITPFAAALVFELLVGALLSLPAALALESFRICGRLWDMFCGARIGEQMLPAASESRSTLEAAFGFAAIALCFSTWSFEQLLLLWRDGLGRVPLGTGFLAAPGGMEFKAEEILRLAALSFSSGCVAAAPAGIVALAADVAAGLTGRLCGRASLDTETAAFKLLAASCLLLWLAPEFAKAVPRMYELRLFAWSALGGR